VHLQDEFGWRWLIGLACRTGIAAGRIAQLFQVRLNLRRYTGEFVELLVRNPPEMLFPDKEWFGNVVIVIPRISWVMF